AKLTSAAHWFGSVPVVMFAGHVIDGGVASVTVTVAVHWLVAPLLSTTVSNTVVVPTGYGPAGDCVMVSVPPSGSNDLLSMDAGAVQVAPAEAVTLWHIATGGWFTVSHAKHAPDTLSVYEHPTALFAPVLT